VQQIKWQKLGLIFAPDRNYSWMVSHAANPVAELLGGSLVRIYFGCRDKENRTNIGFVKVDLEKPQKILEISSEPQLTPGEPGYFDDSGVSLGCVLDSGDGRKSLYYLGWNLAKTVPWRNTIGLAIMSRPDAGFEKFRTVPILDRSVEDPLTMTYPWVIRDKEKWRMWYGSNKCWVGAPHDFIHSLRYAESEDGIHWMRFPGEVLPLNEPDEYLMCRPCILKNGNLYQMWYSYRGEYYKIGYSESEDGRHWKRLDDIGGLDRSENGWDSECVEYASVFDCQGQRFMLYNGNGFGESGFGLAVMQQ
jgi:predicted GH43/DUF377 family glycosyl hydrolase